MNIDFTMSMSLTKYMLHLQNTKTCVITTEKYRLTPLHKLVHSSETPSPGKAKGIRGVNTFLVSGISNTDCCFHGVVKVSWFRTDIFHEPLLRMFHFVFFSFFIYVLRSDWRSMSQGLVQCNGVSRTWQA